jgi:hypothetical protein
MGMGKMEHESGKKRKRNELVKMVLSVVKATGVISLAVVAPNVLGAMAKLGLVRHRRDSEYIKRTVDRLYEQGRLKHAGGKLALTPSGVDLLNTLDLQFKTMKPPKHWDKRWRVLVFDIPEEKKLLRDRVRATLKSIGFVQLQQSVWVYPYDCEDWITLWKAEFKLGSELLYMIVDSIEGESVLRRTFGLRD